MTGTHDDQSAVTLDWGPVLDLDELLLEVVDCCQDLTAARLDRLGERELLVAVCQLMSIEVLLEGVQRRLAERIDAYLADA
jgi:hypothetical protein